MHVRSLHPTSWLARRLGLSVSTIERLRAQGGDTLPPHVIIGRHSIRYDEDVVEAWIEKRLSAGAASREQTEPPPGFRRFGKRLIRSASAGSLHGGGECVSG